MLGSGYGRMLCDGEKMRKMHNYDVFTSFGTTLGSFMFMELEDYIFIDLNAECP